MLYISRSLGSSRYGVADTDDDTEEIVTWGQLSDLVIRLKLDIKGAVLGKNSGGVFLSVAEPYQDMRQYTNLQVKTKTLLGVDVRTYHNEIVRIIINGEVAKADTTIRLSDFGKVMSNNVSIVRINAEGDKKLTFVFDDKIAVAGVKPSMCMQGLRFDIRELNDEDTIEDMYEDMMMLGYIAQVSWERYIIDREDRQKFWKCKYILENVSSSDSQSLEYLDKVHDLEEVSEKIADVCLKEFKELVKVNFRMELFFHGYIDQYRDMTRDHLDILPTLSVKDFERLRTSFIHVFQLMRMSTNFHYDTLRRVENFLRYFKAPLWIQETYVQLCKNVMETVVEFCTENGIRV